MKKKSMVWPCLFLAAVLLGGCGSKESAGDVPLKDMDVEQYVTLGEYQELAVTVAAPAVDQEEWESLTRSVYEDSFPAESGVTDRAVEVGDTANIDYEGKLEGVAFAGGTAAGYNLEIGAGGFIDGFEEGLEGVVPGETVDLNLTFPENYHNTELAGQAVVFTVTVNYIIPPGMDQAVIAQMGIPNVADEEGLRQYVYDYLYAEAQEKHQEALETAVLEALVSGAAFEEVPSELLGKYEEKIRKNIQAAALASGVDANTYTAYFYGMELEDFLASYVENSVKQSLAIQALANAENLNVSDEELEDLLEEAAASAGISVEELLGEVTKEDYREYYTMVNAIEYLMNNAERNE